MTIQNDTDLLAGIEKILQSVSSKMQGNPEASVYLDIFTKLQKIKEKVTVEDFSVESKKACDMSGPLNHLYDGQSTLPPLGALLYAINDYYQSARIEKLDQSGAELFFLFR
jgi:hypothetical protein